MDCTHDGPSRQSKIFQNIHHMKTCRRIQTLILICLTKINPKLN